jgi:predicted ThiF/HesA family dinucleotide-utilizing enzyme
MVGSTYTPQTWESVLASMVSPNVIGVQASIPNGTTQNVDTNIADDSLFRGVKLIAMNTTFGDTVSVKIVDVDGVYSPAGTVLSSPVLNFNISTDQQLQADYESVAPFKILGGLYVRITYVSTGGLLSSVKIGADLFLIKVLQ